MFLFLVRLFFSLIYNLRKLFEIFELNFLNRLRKYIYQFIVKIIVTKLLKNQILVPTTYTLITNFI